jgi:pSer/pThr/pTyr-binding forkhead associated (FHA) protein
MDETQEHRPSAKHALQGPHKLAGNAPEHGAFVPLQLVVLPGGERIEVAKSMALIGRHSDVELRLSFPDVSRRHCRLLFDDGVWQIHDLDSLNGLFVNGERMQEATLYDGDRIRIGEATLLVIAAPAPVPKPAGPATEMLRSIADALPPRSV